MDDTASHSTLLQSVWSWILLGVFSNIVMWRGSLALRQVDVLRNIVQKFEIEVDYPVTKLVLAIPDWGWWTAWGSALVLLFVFERICRQKYIANAIIALGCVAIYFSIDVIHEGIIYTQIRLLSSL